MINQELLNSFLSVILPALATLIAAWFAILGAKIKNSYEEKVKDETKKKVVDSTVKYIEQVYKDLHGEEKLNKAIEQASLLLMEKGITISELEIKMLLEAAVLGLNRGLKDDISKEEEAK